MHRQNASRLLRAPSFETIDARDIHALNHRVQEERDVLFRLHGGHLAVVLVLRSGLRVAALGGTDFGDHVAEARIRPEVLVPAQMDAHFGGIGAAQDRTVLHERDLEPQPRRRDGRADAGDAAAHHGEVRLDELRLQGRRRTRRRLGVRRETHGVHAAVEALEVTDRHRVFPGLEVHLVGLDPQPFALPLHTQDGRRLDAVHRELERARAGRGAPLGRPVLRAREDIVPSRLWHGEGCLRVRHGHAEAVRDEIGGAHFEAELRIELPPAQFLELLALEENRFGARRKRGADGGKKQRCFLHAVDYTTASGLELPALGSCVDKY